MNKSIVDFFGFKWLFVISLFVISGCSKPQKKQQAAENKTIPNTTPQTKAPDFTVNIKKEPTDFLPEGYKIFEKSYGDLNKDGVDDCILIIKKTDQTKIITDEYRGKLDRNRRGIIILFKNKDGYQLASKNVDCFSSENEEGGVYYAPELSVSAEKGNLYIHYAHGRYGYWTYTLRYRNSDFELIGFDDSSNTGPVVNSETSINFLTGKRLVKVNVNEGAESGEEKFNDTWEKLNSSKLLSLSEIKDFDELDFSDY